MKCPLTGLNGPRLFMAAITGFIFIFGYEFLVHHILLMDQYEATKDVWRSEEEMQSLFKWALASQFGIALATAMLYGVFVTCKSLGKSLKFGIFLGLVMGIGMFGSYPYYPIPMSLAIAWLVAGIVKGTGLGVVYKFAFCLGSSCEKKSCGTETCKTTEKSEEKEP